MEEVANVLLGAVLGFFAAIVGERLKVVHSSRTTAMMVARELEFHKLRLSMVLAFDKNPQAEYGIKFPATVWLAQSETLLAGAPVRDAEALLNWYASLAVLGYELQKRLSPDGPVFSGPARDRLQTVLNEAHSAARRIAVRWTFRRRRTSGLSLFDEVASRE